MSLSSALATAMAGLHTNQAALSIVSSNIANAQTPGYVTRTLTQIEIAGSSSDTGASVRTTAVNRQLDLYLQTQLRTETSAGAYADKMSNVLGQLQSVYGTPGGAGTLETSRPEIELVEAKTRCPIRWRRAPSRMFTKPVRLASTYAWGFSME